MSCDLTPRAIVTEHLRKIVSMSANRVYLEQGTRTVFAVSLDWPGWCRRAKTDDLAIEELERYAKRYAKIVSVPVTPGPFRVVGRVTGNATTDFGAPDALGPWDQRAVDQKSTRTSRQDPRRLLGVFRSSYRSGA